MSGGHKQPARIDCAAGVAYGSDVDEVRALLYQIAEQLDHLSSVSPDTQPQVHFVNMGASSLDFVLRIWIDEPEYIPVVQDQVNTLIYKKFTEKGIEIPYTKQDVYLYDMSPPKPQTKS